MKQTCTIVVIIRCNFTFYDKQVCHVEEKLFDSWVLRRSISIDNNVSKFRYNDLLASDKNKKSKTIPEHN